MMDVVWIDLPADYELKTNRARWWGVFNGASPSATQSQYSVQDILSL
jgi:hypothetical protein